MKRQLVLSFCLALVAVAVLATRPAHCQLPSENHYKVYQVLAPVPLPTVPGPIGLTDQFGSVIISSITLEKFAIPAEKNGEPIIDPLRHLTWWRFTHPEPVRRVSTVDQFGLHSWRLRDSMYLLAPAGKNQTQIPAGNHYKCYDAEGPALGINVTLVDQVDTVTVTVMDPCVFCNPVEKSFQGHVYQIENTQAHLTCYRVQNPKLYLFEDQVIDQFGDRLLTLGENLCLCLPAIKEGAVPTEQSTWGHIKALYR